MKQTDLSLVFSALFAAIAIGVLLLMTNVGPGVEVKVRLTDVAAETAAGNMGPGSTQAVEEVDLEGVFESFDGQPGETVSSWPRFRGADFSNIARDNVSLAEAWGESGPPVVWRVSLGKGHAGPAVWKGRVYVMDYDEEREGDALRCFSFADGREIWRRWYKAPTKWDHGMSRTVPAVTERHVVAMGPRCYVLCVETETGKYCWGLDLVKDFGAEVPLWYTGQCPLVDDATAVLAPAGGALMIGVECETGTVTWQTPNSMGWKMSHSSIIPMTLLGKRMYVYAALGGLAGVSAEEEDRGALLWTTTEWNHSVTSPSPVAVDGHRIFLTAGYGGGSMMLGLKREGERFVAEKLFELDKTVFSCEQQTPILYQGHLFGVLPKDAAELRARFACLSTDGELIWTSGKTERFGLGPFLVADGKVLILKDNGELTMIRASLKGYERLARFRVLEGHDAWAPMALVDGKLLLRDSETMICLDVGVL